MANLTDFKQALTQNHYSTAFIQHLANSISQSNSTHNSTQRSAPSKKSMKPSKKSPMRSSITSISTLKITNW